MFWHVLHVGLGHAAGISQRSVYSSSSLAVYIYIIYTFSKNWKKELDLVLKPSSTQAPKSSPKPTPYLRTASTCHITTSFDALNRLHGQLPRSLPAVAWCGVWYPKNMNAWSIKWNKRIVISIQFVLSLISHTNAHDVSSAILGTLSLSLHSKIGAGRC